MKAVKPLLLIVLFMLGLSLGHAQTVTWQMHHGQGAGVYVPPEGAPSIRDILTTLYGNPVHGDPGGYQFAQVPPADDPAWEPAPVDPADGQLCFRLDRSELFTFMTELDFTYFQTTINVTDTSIPFNILYQQVDDGVRAYVYNSSFPEGEYIEGGDARLYVDSVEVDLSPLFVEGENRIVLVQFDNAQTENYLKAVVTYNVDECNIDSTPPTLDLSSIVVDTIPCADPTTLPEPDLANFAATDNCDETPMVVTDVEFVDDEIVRMGSDDPLNDRPIKIGTIVNHIYTATDAAGNSVTDTVTAYYIPLDREAPIVIGCPTDDVIVELDANNEATLSLSALGISFADNCTASEDLLVDINPALIGPDTEFVGITVTDEAGNTGNCTFPVQPVQPDPCVDDTEAPMLDLSSITVDTIPCIEAADAPAPVDIVATDNCDENPTVGIDVEFVDDEIVRMGSDDPLNDRPIKIGTIVNHIYTATDASGNSVTDTVTAYYIPLDREGPVFDNCPTTLTVTLDVCDQYELSIEELGASATDNCSDVSFALDQTTLIGAGTNKVSLTATDALGNSTPCEIEVTTETNPDAVTVIAENDTLETIIEQSLLIDPATLLANDFVSKDRNLEVQDLMLSNPDDGTLTPSPDGTFTFTPADGFVGEVELTYLAKTDDESLFFPGTGNFYEFVPSGSILWTDAKAQAEARTLNGINGYLATVTSQAENDFIQTKLQGEGWMGATDLEEDDVWRWVVGPEAGQVFWRGGPVAEGGMAENGAFANWQTGEPNDFRGVGENYAHFRANGEWNDYPENGTGLIQGYVVEYGGVNGCVPDFSDEATVLINVVQPPCNLLLTNVETSGTCPGDETGTIEIIAAGSNNVLEYSINGTDYQASNVFTGLADGTYIVTVREVENPSCDATGTYTIDEIDDVTPPEFDFSEIMVDTLTCILPDETPLPSEQPPITDNCDPNPSIVDFTILFETIERRIGDSDDPINNRLVEVGTLVKHVYVAQDASGNEGTDTVDVYYVEKDRAAPSIIGCPQDVVIILLDENNEFVPDLDFFGMSVTDNCTAAEDMQVAFSPSVFTSETTEATLNATDAAGNTAISCMFSIEVVLPECANDTASPVVIDCPSGGPFTVELDANGELQPSLAVFGASASDNCTAPEDLSITFSSDLITAESGGLFTIFATDAAGLTGQCAFPINVVPFGCANDTEAPQAFGIFADSTAVLLTDFFADGVYQCGEVPFVDIFVVDNCDDNVQIIDGPTQIFDNGDGTFTAFTAFSLGDAAGNTADYSYAYEYEEDTVAPEFLVDGQAFDFQNNNYNVEITADECNVFVFDFARLNISFSDNCTAEEDLSFSGFISGIGSSAIEFGAVVPGNYTLDLTLIDEAGNSTQVDNVFLEVLPNPTATSITTVDKNETVVAGNSLTLSFADIIAGDAASNEANLELTGIFPVDDAEVTVIDNGDFTFTFTPAAGIEGNIVLEYTVAPTEGACIGVPAVGFLNIDVTAAPGISESEPTINRVSMELFPNPARDLLNIELDSDQRVELIQVRDRLGKLIWSQAVDDKQASIQLSLNDGKFTSGFYSVALIGRNGLIMTKPLSIIR